MTNVELVHRHLRRGRAISSQQAFALYNITRLADCIHKLHRRGYAVDTELVPHRGTRYARYRLVR